MFKCSNVKILKLKGFTLVEILVVIFIIVLMSGIIFANYRQTGLQFALQRSVNKLALDIRRAEEMAMSAKEFEGTIPKGGYGMYINLNAPFNEGYIIFADCDGDFHYDENGGAPDCASATPANPYPEKVEQIYFERGVTVCKLCTAGADQLHLVYTPPDPKVTITEVKEGVESQPNYMEIGLKITLPNGEEKNKWISVNSAGLIWIKQ